MLGWKWLKHFKSFGKFAGDIVKCLIACSKKWFTLNRSAFPENIEFHFVSQSDELNKAFLDKLLPDFIFFPHWSWIVDKSIYETYECVVFHTAPLPYGRGGSPIQNLIVEGFDHAPVCALKMTSVVDGGPIYVKKDVSLNGPLSTIFENLNDVVNDLISIIVRTRPRPEEQTGEVFHFKRRTHLDNAIPNQMSLKEVWK